jgi:hypothetical protein
MSNLPRSLGMGFRQAPPQGRCRSPGPSLACLRRTNAEERLRESEARPQAAVDLVKLGQYSWNPQTDEPQWDDTVRAMWVLPADAPVNYSVWRTGVHPDDLARVEAATRRCTRPEGRWSVRYRVSGDWKNRRRGALDRNPWPNTVRERLVGSHSISPIGKLSKARLNAIAEATVRQLQRLGAFGQITSGVAHDFNNL